MIIVTVDSLNLPEELKSDPAISERAARIIERVRRIIFTSLKFSEEAVSENTQAYRDFSEIIRMETETRIMYHGAPTASGETAPKYVGMFYSSDAYMLWSQYYDPLLFAE